MFIPKHESGAEEQSSQGYTPIPAAGHSHLTGYYPDQVVLP